MIFIIRGQKSNDNFKLVYFQNRSLKKVLTENIVSHMPIKHPVDCDQNVTITELLFSKTSITRCDGFIGSQRESRKIQSSSGMKTSTRRPNWYTMRSINSETGISPYPHWTQNLHFSHPSTLASTPNGSGAHPRAGAVTYAGAYSVRADVRFMRTEK